MSQAIDALERPVTAIWRLTTRSVARAIVLGVVVAIALLTLAAGFSRHPYLELATHFRVQYALAGVACAIALAILRSPRSAILALTCVAANGAYIAPFYASSPSAGRDIGPCDHVRLMLSNVYLANRDYDALVRAVRDEQPDIVVLEEITGPWWRNVGELRREYPYCNALPRQGGSGIAILSKLPIDETEVLTFDEPTQPGMFARLRIGGRHLSLLALHPPTPMRPDKLRLRNEQFRIAAARMRSADEPRILIGDLNSSPWSPYFGDLVRDSGLHDARIGAGLWTTWPVPMPSLLRIPIDHCLTSDDVRVDSIHTGERTGSDHRPIVVDVSVARP